MTHYAIPTPTLDQIKTIADELNFGLDIYDCMVLLNKWEAEPVPPLNLTIFIVNMYYHGEEAMTNKYTIPQDSLKETQKAITEMLEEQETLDKSRELLGKAYQLFLQKQQLIKDIEAVTEEMESCIHFAFEELPNSHDPEDWLIIGKDVICKWPDPCDQTHIVDFRIIH